MIVQNNPHDPGMCVACFAPGPHPYAWKMAGDSGSTPLCEPCARERGTIPEQRSPREKP